MFIYFLLHYTPKLLLPIITHFSLPNLQMTDFEASESVRSSELETRLILKLKPLQYLFRNLKIVSWVTLSVLNNDLGSFLKHKGS